MSKNHRILLAVTVLAAGLFIGLLLLPNLSHAPFTSVEPQRDVFEVSLETEQFFSILETQLSQTYGSSTKGFEPETLMRSFPGLQGEDFAGVEAVIGYYEYANGTTTYIGNSVVDDSADDITIQGYETLRVNFYNRVGLLEGTESSIVLEFLMAAPGLDVTDAAACPLDAKVCPDGSTVSREGADCEFAACPGSVASEKMCNPDERAADVCIELYAPVCASVEVQCVTTPCNPIPQTFLNSCFACANEQVTSYVDGECPTPLL
jgi:hypothetical protein